MKKVYSLLLTLFLSASVFAAGHTVSIAQTNITCFGVCNGEATATVIGGVGPFTYNWTPSGGTAPSAISLCAGSYTVIVTDNSDMSTATATVTITEPPLLTVSIGGSGALCTGGCTTLTPAVTGGTVPYTFNWSGGLFGVSPSACPSSLTTYTVTITDSQGCIATNSSTITVNPIPIVTVNSPTICTGGIATLTGGGATTYLWSTGATVNPLILSPATSMNYTVTGTALGCTATAISTVTVNPLPSLTLTPINATCGLNNGGITPTGGCAYSWISTGTPAAGASLSGLGAGTYTVTTSCLGCTSTAITTISTTPAPTVTVSPSSTICSGACVTLSATTTPGPSTYSWIGPAAFVATIASPIICPAIMGTYTVTASYAGCTATAITTVNIDGPITPNLSSTNTTGCVTCDGTATATPTGGTAPYAYVWSNGTTTIPVPSMCAGTYSVTITDIAGCTATDSTTIFANNSAITNFTMVPDSTDPYNFFAFNTSTGIGNSYSWDWGDGTAFSTTANPAHTWGSTGVMTVCLTVSNFLCGADTLCQTVNVTGAPVSCLALFNIADDTINPDPNAHYVYNLSYGATLSYFWDFGDGTTSTSMIPSHVYSGTGPYLLCLSVDNGAGCTDMFCDSLISADSLNRSSGTMQIIVHNGPSFQGLTTGIVDQESITTVSVSPNPFSDNTSFIIQSDKINEKYSFELLDVLGKKVKTLNGISEKQFEISRNGLQNGVYFYKIYSAESIVGIGKLVIE